MGNENNRCFAGLEIGAVSIKWVRRSQTGQTDFECFRHEGNPKEKLKAFFKTRQQFQDQMKIIVTGQAAKAMLDLPYRAEAECLERALCHLGLKPDILVSLGGESFTLFTLRNGQIKNIIPSSKCAAGTGEFIVQQFQRMDYDLEEGIHESRTGTYIPLASRCSVHCKSDATHLLNKGEAVPADIAKTLIVNLAAKVSKMIETSRWRTDSIVVIGGVTLNQPFIESLKEKLSSSKIDIPVQSPYFEAFGASLCAADPEVAPLRIDPLKMIRDGAISFGTLPPLMEKSFLLDFRVNTLDRDKIVPDASYILGVDAGSTTTKGVLYNISDGTIGASSYLRTFGNPVAATRQVLLELKDKTAGKPFKIIQAAVTGSGRELVSVYLDNCESFNEILAHAKAAAIEVPEVDTVFEIGGQDSKYISFLHGVPVDYAMNEGCSAGTGSFLEESVSTDMGITVKEISGWAEKSERPIAFGERCAAFINTDLRSALQQGASRENVIAGLVTSIADNYISRVVGIRNIGDHLLFQGGVALNRSVALAIAAQTQRKVVVPRYPELMGCIGAALMMMDLLAEKHVQEKTIDLDHLAESHMEVKGVFQCKACENRCEIKNISVNSQILPFGGLCSKYEKKRHVNRNANDGMDLVALRNEIMYEPHGPNTLTPKRGTIGLPVALTTHELFPLYSTWIVEMGFEPVLSRPSKTGNAKTRSEICYPGEIVHGAVYDLLERGVDFIFLPRVIDGKTRVGYLYSYTCPTTTIMPDIIKAAFDTVPGKLLSPHIGLSKEHIDTTIKEFGRAGERLGFKKKVGMAAAKKALDHYYRYEKTVMEQGKRLLPRLLETPTVIIAGRPYISCSSETNLALPRKITSRGYNIVPMDMLPPIPATPHPRNVWYYTQQIMNAVAYVKRYPNMYICFVSCFSCIPDTCLYHLVREELSGHTFCYLEIDSHTAHAGFDTRIGAFLDIIEERRRGRMTPAPAAAKEEPPDAPIRPARFSGDYTHIIDSDGKQVPLDDPRVVHVWTAEADPYIIRMAVNSFARRGWRYRIMARTTPEILEYGKKLCSGRECVACTSVAGLTYKDILENRKENEITVYYSLDQQGPCQNGGWPMIWDTFARKLHLRNVLFFTQPKIENNYLGQTIIFATELIMAYIVGEFLGQAKSMLNCVIEDEKRVQAFEVFEAECDRAIETIRKWGLAGVAPAVVRWTLAIRSKIHSKKEMAMVPKVLVAGGMNVQCLHHPLSRQLEEHGIYTKTGSYMGALFFLTLEPIVRYGFKRGMTDPRHQLSFTRLILSFIHPDFQFKKAARLLIIRGILTAIDLSMFTLRKIMHRSGLVLSRHEPFLNFLYEGRNLASFNGISETSVVAGALSQLMGLFGDSIDGVLCLGSFNCQPALNTQAVIRPISNQMSIPFTALDLEGPCLSSNEERMLETFITQVRLHRKNRNQLKRDG